MSKKTNLKRRKQLSFNLDAFYQNPVAQVSLELFLTVGLILFLAVFAIRPTLLTMSDLLKEIEDKKQLEQQLSQKATALATAQSEYLAVADRLTVLDEALPTQPQIITSIKKIEKMAHDSNVVISSLSILEIPENQEQNVDFTRLTRINPPISISVLGDYSSIRQFVEELQQSRRSFVIDTVVFALQEDRGTLKLRASITLTAPYFGVKK